MSLSEGNRMNMLWTKKRLKNKQAYSQAYTRILPVFLQEDIKSKKLQKKKGCSLRLSGQNQVTKSYKQQPNLNAENNHTMIYINRIFIVPFSAFSTRFFCFS